MGQKSRTSSIIWALYIVWGVALTLLVYGKVLTLPFFFDDLAHMPYVDTHTLAEIWQSAGTFPYYRPLQSTVWKLLNGLFGSHDPAGAHSMNLLLHALNGLLVGWLAGQLWPKRSFFDGQSPSAWLRIFLSATLFVLFPFSYQAVPWVGSLAHLLVTTLILLTLATYWQMRRSNRRIWGALSLLLALLAPFAHENGVLVGPLLAAILFTRPDYRLKWTRDIRHVAIWTLPALIWLVVWWFIPKGASDGLAIRNGETLLQNTAYVAQAAAYPLTWLGGWLRDSLSVNDMTVVAGLSVLAFLGAALIQWFSNAGRRSLLPWLWFAIASLPTIVFLQFDYVINGPRLLMLASVGIAWLWADVAIQAIYWVGDPNKDVSGRRWPRLALVVAVVLVLLLQNYSFLRHRMGLHQMLGSAYWEVVSLTRETNGAGKETVIVNLPAWMAPGRATYALGHEGIQFLPHYMPPESLVSVNGGFPARLMLVRNEAIRPEMPYHYGLGGSTANLLGISETESDVYVTEYAPESVTFRLVGTLEPLDTLLAEPLATFEEPDGNGRITLASASAKAGENGVTVNLIWQVDQPPAEHITAFVHIVDDQGQLVAQMDGDPFGGSYPLNQWKPGSIGEDRRSVVIEGNDFTVLVGLYHRLSGERLPGLAASEQLWPDGAVPVPVD